jgi:hypothetical protein
VIKPKLHSVEEGLSGRVNPRVIENVRSSQVRWIYIKIVQADNRGIIFQVAALAIVPA